MSESNKPLVPSEHIPGSGCLCGASSSFECGCEIVDWRSRREVELEAENAKLRKVVEAAKTELKIIYDYAQVGNSTNCGIQTIAANLGEVEKHAYRAITELEQIRCNSTNLKQG